MMSASRDPYGEGLQLSKTGRHAQAIEKFELALARNPDDVRVLFALAGTARTLGLLAVAEKFYLRVLALEPDRLEAVVNLANMLRELGRLDEAETLLSRALNAKPGAAELWLTLGSVLREAGQDEQATVFYRKALEIRPGYVLALGNLADMLSDHGSTSEALKLYETILAAEPDNAQARFHRALLRLLIGDLVGGWREYGARIQNQPSKVPRPDHGLPRWDGVFGENLRLLVTAEQGVGDQIMFASPFAELERRLAERGGTLILECEPRLVGLLSRSFATAVVRPWAVESHAGVVRAQYAWLADVGGADAFVEMGTLPAFLRTRLDDFPRPNTYLRVDAADQSRWRLAFQTLPRPLVGLCWRSGKRGGQRTRQYAPAQPWAQFLATLPGTPISAQYDARPEEIAALEMASGRCIVVPTGLDQKNELDRTAAMLSTLDAVVSAPTAVSWLAAAAGTAVVKLLTCPSWTSFGTDFEPFAPAAVCLHPAQVGAEAGDWAAVFAEAVTVLAATLAQTKPAKT
jgi:Flp pilus assembly protein TadD